MSKPVSPCQRVKASGWKPSPGTRLKTPRERASERGYTSMRLRVAPLMAVQGLLRKT
jgi:hypothetical protein